MTPNADFKVTTLFDVETDRQSNGQTERQHRPRYV